MISVIVPIYNVAPYLKQCLDSLLHQSYRDWQGILVNDGSTDDSLAIAEQYVQADNRFTLYSQPNSGLSAARNTGLKYATGEYVAFIDSDDYIAPDYLATLIAHADGAELVQSGLCRVDNEGKILRRIYPRPAYRLTTAWSRLYRRTLFTEQQLSFAVGQYYEDVLFSTDLWLSHPRIRAIDYCGYYYRLNNTSITANKHDTTFVFEYLRRKQKEIKSLRDWWIICSTRIRLRAHFILNR